MFFFGNARPKSNAHAHVKQRKKHRITLAIYTCRQIYQDRMIFGDFFVNFVTDFLEILHRLFSIKILTAVKKLQNYVYYFKIQTICHVIKFLN